MTTRHPADAEFLTQLFTQPGGQWEYHVIALNARGPKALSEAKRRADALGLDGWELAAAAPDSGAVTLWFKRQLPSAAGDADRHVANRLLRLREVEDIAGISRSTIYRRIGQKTFPAPIDIGNDQGDGGVRWRESDIEDWIRSLPSRSYRQAASAT